MLALIAHDSQSATVSCYLYLYVALSTLLYPYARFVYHAASDFLLGEQVVFLRMSFALYLKWLMMAACWVGAVVIAPLGLLYLGFCRSK